MNLERPALDTFYDISESHYESARSIVNNHFILHYTGDLNYGFANAISGRLERLLNLHILNKQAHKRFFSVFVEAIQNIRIHGCVDADDRVHAGINVFTTQNTLNADLLSIVTRAQAKLLAVRYNDANAMPRDLLKSRYLDIMQNGDLSGKGGAGLGIITIVLRSQNPSPFWIYDLDEVYQIFKSRITVNLD
jgi:hypothetical protein